VRINPGVSVHTHINIKTGEKDSKFGVDFKTAFEIYKLTYMDRYLNIKSVHFHLGSQIFEAEPYRKALEKILNFIGILKENNIFINTVDIGGGWGVKEGEESGGHKMLYNVIKPYMKDFNFIIEPGRSIVASSGVLLARVLYRKKVDNKYIVIVDAGMNDFIRPALYGSVHPVFNLSNSCGSIESVDIAGPLCESSDFFIKNIKMPLPEQNDIILVSSTGAYGYSMSSNYNLREKPEEKIINR
jgi:diaminopimelate decarboxylase